VTLEAKQERAATPRPSWGVRALLGMIIVANAVLLMPYVRTLWWLHAYANPPRVYVIPVKGVTPDALTPSFGAPRQAGPHEGIDIAAPAGTPVLAAADGVVIGNRRTAIGGNVLWLMGTGRRLYYYAHLRELEPGMHMGRRIAAGEQIGSVGNTGNAMMTPAHLHFAIYEVTSHFFPMRYRAMDPYPLLVGTSLKGSPVAGQRDGRPRAVRRARQRLLLGQEADPVDLLQAAARVGSWAFGIGEITVQSDRRGGEVVLVCLHDDESDQRVDLRRRRLEPRIVTE